MGKKLFEDARALIQKEPFARHKKNIFIKKTRKARFKSASPKLLERLRKSAHYQTKKDRRRKVLLLLLSAGIVVVIVSLIVWLFMNSY